MKKQIEQIVILSSRDRNASLFPSTSRYQVQIPPIRNIRAVEFVGGIVPDKNSVTSEPYLILCIDELQHENLIATNRHLEKSFAILMLSPAVLSNAFINIDTSLTEKTIFQTNTSGITLNKLTITIQKSTGETFDFGGDYESMFILKFICEP